MQFTTHDRDLDMMVAESCSDRNGRAGWWFNACYRMGNLNGWFGVRDKGGMSYWNGTDVYVRNSEIKVQPRKGK